MNGPAVGAGINLALACDVRIAAEGARFMLPEVGHGVIPDTGGVAALFQMCGPGVVADMVLTGRVLSAEEALGHGIVSRIVAHLRSSRCTYSGGWCGLSGEFIVPFRLTWQLVDD